MLTQVSWLNEGLARFQAMSVVPVFQTFWIFVSAIAGFVFYNEWENFSVFQSLMFPLGMCLTLYGVMVLSNKATHIETHASFTTDKQHDGVLDETTPLLFTEGSQFFRHGSRARSISGG